MAARKLLGIFLFYLISFGVFFISSARPILASEQSDCYDRIYQHTVIKSCWDPSGTHCEIGPPPNATTTKIYGCYWDFFELDSCVAEVPNQICGYDENDVCNVIWGGMGYGSYVYIPCEGGGLGETTCGDELYPSCQDGACNQNQTCRKDGQGGCKCVANFVCPAKEPKNLSVTYSGASGTITWERGEGGTKQRLLVGGYSEVYNGCRGISSPPCVIDVELPSEQISYTSDPIFASGMTYFWRLINYDEINDCASNSIIYGSISSCRLSPALISYLPMGPPGINLVADVSAAAAVTSVNFSQASYRPADEYCSLYTGPVACRQSGYLEVCKWVAAKCVPDTTSDHYIEFDGVGYVWLNLKTANDWSMWFLLKPGRYVYDDFSYVYSTLVERVRESEPNDITKITANVLLEDDTGTRIKCTNTVNVLGELTSGAWWQVKDGDVTASGDLTSNVPNGKYFLTDGDGGFPGVALYGGATNLTSGLVSSKGWLANSLSSSLSTRVFNYDYFAGQIPADVVFNPVDSNSVEAGYFASGGTETDGYYWYKYNGAALGGDLNLNGAVDLGSRKVVLMVDSANLHLNGNINFTKGEGFFLAITDENIEVDPAVTQLTGFFLAGGAFSTGSTGAVDVQFNVRGSVAAYGGLALERDLGETANSTTPAEVFEYAPEMIFDFPETLYFRKMRWEEVAP